MDTEFDAFAKKLMLLVETCHRLRAENQRLRDEFVESRNEVRRLQERLDGARARLEKLVEQLPDEMP